MASPTPFATTQTLTRRRFLAGAGVGAIAALGVGLSGCTTPALVHGTTPTTGTAAPKDGDSAWQVLQAGNQRYVAGKATHPDQSPQRRTDLSRGQQPFAIVLACSDSRVAPELLFDQGLGDLFVIRVAGNVVDDAVTGSIEYAVEHLGSPLLVVLGHEACGAVTAAVDAVTKGAEVPAHIAALVDPIRPAVEQVRGQPGDLVDNAVRANVKRQAGLLSGMGPVLAPAIAAGHLKVVGARYALATGAVERLI